MASASPPPSFFMYVLGTQIQVFRQSRYTLNQLLRAIIKNMYVYKYMKTSPLIQLCMPCSLLWLNYLYISGALSFIYLICMPGKQSHRLSFRLEHLPNASANFASFSVFAINSAWTAIFKFSALYILLVLTLRILFQHWHSYYFRHIIFKHYLLFLSMGAWSVCAPCAWGALRNQNRETANLELEF